MPENENPVRERIVQLTPSVDVQSAIVDLQRLCTHPLLPLRLIRGFRCRCSDAEAGQLAKHPKVSTVEDDGPVFAVPTTGDVVMEQGSQVFPGGVWHIRAPRAWSISRGAGVTVAILDTGFDLDHPDLAPNRAPGYNFVEPGTPPDDDNGHGTHVAGTLAAVDNNFGVVGVAPAAKVSSVKVLDAAGGGTVSNIIQGLDFALKRGIPIANLSLGTSQDFSSLRTAVANAILAGLTIVAAAGNTASRQILYPAAYPDVLAVGAVTVQGQLASFSSFGPELDLVAPGTNILSTLPGGYGKLSGTSMATPHVSGTAALFLSRYPDQTPERVAAALQATSVLLPDLNSEEQGAGRVDALGAVRFNPGN